jgi:hypothetical protein
MFEVCGRRVKVVKRRKSQTVNICTSDNIEGVYDYIVRLRPPFIDEDTLRDKMFATTDDLVRYLQNHHHGDIEKTPVKRLAVSSRHATQPAIRGLPVSATPQVPIDPQLRSSWEANARAAVEQSIDQFILEFIEFPYLHRVEHSVHCELFQILARRKIFCGTYPMSRWLTQPIHKEWPEYLARPEKGTRRGNFDLAVLSPERLKSCSFSEFREGRVRPSIVIELGLDYDLSHLTADAAKLKNSAIEDSYLVHLVRQDFIDDFDAVEQFLLGCGLRTGYARLTSNRAFYKLTRDEKIRSVDVPFTESLA